MKDIKSLNLTYIEKEPKDCIAECFRMINEKVVGVLFVDTNETFVFKGNSNKNFNMEYCIENKIPVYSIHTNGGAIISMNGDFSFGICVPKEYVGVRMDFVLKKVKEIFEQYTNRVEIKGNDILINDKKVLGSAIYRMNDMFMWVGHFSFVDSADLIKKICPESVKEPSFISEITREQFKQEVLKWLL